ncbi:type III PLP-dependent enzyme [Actinoplanes sp. NPDC020271]|uniref:type III PLP-dependent enzyme n=1 Tax=Actinoplanes sp. NPDC020271 TaxID=3363896 RepID=UPI0037BAF392
MNLTAIAEQYGTPAYVYDLAAIRAAHTDLSAMLPGPAKLYYSLKANPHPLVVGQLHRLGCHAEVSSAGEIDAALAAGVDAHHILLTAPGKSAATVSYALRQGVRRFSLDSPVDLRRVAWLAEQSGTDVRCLLRVNADQPVAGLGLTMTGAPSAFGADASWIEADPAQFRGGGRVRIEGLHLYMGTNIADEDALIAQFDTAAATAQRLGPVLGELIEVDLGGGFGAPYAQTGSRPLWPSLRPRIEQVLDTRLPGWRDARPAVAFESGRYLAGSSGSLLCGVVDVKTSKGKTFVVLDTGINHLGGMAGLRRLPPLRPALAVTGPDDGRPTTRTTVVGPLCTPLDTFVRDADFPEVHPGELLAVPNVGAYGLTASLLGFLGHPAPVEVVCDGDTVLDVSHLVLAREPGPYDPAVTAADPAVGSLV